MGAAAAAASGAGLVSVGNSALFSTTSQELERTPSTAGNLDKWTFSAWVYFCAPTGASSKPIFGAINGSANQQRLMLTNTGAIQFDWYSSSSYAGRLITSQLLRDIGWYHIVAVYDSGNAISSQRQQLYLNGQRITAFGTEAYVSQNLDGLVNSAVMHQIGLHDGLTLSTDGYIAEAVLLDGTAAEPTSFGAYDSSGLFWTPLASATIQELTFGTNGFYLANKVTDAPQLDFQGGDDNTVILSQYKSLLHFDGSDTSTTFTDSSSSASNWTAAGNAQLDTAYKKFGTASLLLDGTGDYAYHTTLATVGTQDFTIDLQVRRNGANTDNAILTWGDSGADTGLRILSSTDNKLIVSTGNAAVIGTGDHSTSLPDGEFAHVEMVRSGNTLYLFQNGTLLSSKSFSYNLSSTSAWWIGDDVVSSAPSNFNGHIDEVRIAIGYAAHTSGFTAPTSAYSNPPTANNWKNTGSVTTNTHTPTNLKPLLNELNSSTNTTLSNGNQSFVNSAANNIAFGTIPLPSTGKWYFEYKLNNASSASIVHLIGLMKLGNPAGWTSGISSGFTDMSACYLAAAQQIWEDGSLLNSPSTGAGSINDILSLAVDLDNTKMWIGYNNSFYNASGGTDGNPATGANAMSTKNFSDNYGIIVGLYSSQGTIQFDTDDFSYTPPSGYSSLNSTTLTSETTRTASDTTKYFDTILYEGNGNFQRVGQFQPFTDSFTIANSAVFNHSGYLTRTQSSPTDQDVWTLSWWMKASNPAALVNGVFGVATANQDIIYYTTALIYLVLSATTEFSRDIDDSSQWQHIMFTNNSGTLGFYWNGQSQGSASGSQHSFNSAVEHSIGSYNGGSGGIGGNPMAAYMADVIFVDGTVHPVSVFGQTDTTSGRWVPKDPTTTLDEASDFGNNGYFLNFANSSDMGNDVSGNNHDWTTNNTISQSTDTPTSNFAILDANQTTWGGAVTLSAGNLTAEGTTTTLSNNITSTLTMYSGKYVYAFKPDSVLNLEGQAGIVNDACYIARPNDLQSGGGGTWSAEFNGSVSQFAVNQNGTRSTLTPNSNYEVGDYIIVALDVDNLLVWLGHYDASTDTTKWYNSVAVDWTGNPATGTGGSPIYGNWFKFSVALYSGRGGVADFGQNSLLSNIDIPTGFNYLTQDNITSSDQFISAFSWIKNRDATDNHMLFDRVRGVTKDIHSNTTDAQVTNVQTVQEFLAGGVQVGTDVQVNTANESYVLWNWMMEATGSGASNTDGSINTTKTLVDTTLGLSISTYDGTGANATVGHGLGVAPEFIIIKKTSASGSGWYCYHVGLDPTAPQNKVIYLDTTGAVADDVTYWNDTAPTSSVFSLGTTTNVNGSGVTYVAYCFADSQFISTGSFEGNANNNGTFIPTVNSLGIPIQPTWMLIKNIDATSAWGIFDTSRSPINQGNKNIYPNYNNAEDTGNGFDIVTGGFKNRLSSAFTNASNTFIYMAIGTPIIDTDGRIIAGR